MVLKDILKNSIKKGMIANNCHEGGVVVTYTKENGLYVTKHERVWERRSSIQDGSLHISPISTSVQIVPNENGEGYVAQAFPKDKIYLEFGVMNVDSAGLMLREDTPIHKAFYATLEQQSNLKNPDVNLCKKIKSIQDAASRNDYEPAPTKTRNMYFLGSDKSLSRLLIIPRRSHG